jgi:hypothetical protein
MSDKQFRTGSFVREFTDSAITGWVVTLGLTHAEVYYPELCGRAWVPLESIETTEEPSDIEKMFER